MKLIEEAQHLFNQEKFEDSKKICQKILKDDPKCLDALILISTIAIQTNHLDKSIEILDYTEKLYPDVLEIFFYKSHAYFQKKLYEKSLLNIDKAIALDNKNFNFLNLKGLIFLKIKNYEESIKNFEDSILINIKNSEAYTNLIFIYNELKNFNKALEIINKAITFFPNNSDYFDMRGKIYVSLNDLVNAKKNFLKALSINENNQSANNNIATLEIKDKNYKEATKYYKKILNKDYILGHYLHAKNQICDWDNYNENISLIRNKINEGVSCTDTFQALSFFDDSELIYKNSRIQSKSINFKTDLNLVYEKKNEKIKIGYYSADFRDHPVGFHILDLIKNHNRSKFEIIAFSFLNKDNDKIQSELKKNFDKFINVEKKSNDEIVNLSRELKINISLDLMGYTSRNRIKIFEKRCAPIQINFFGYPATSGLKNIDYIIADKNMITENKRANYSEVPVYLPNTFMVTNSYNKVVEKKLKREDFGIPENVFIFSNFGNYYKITPQIFKTWMQVMYETENSILWLSENSQDGVANIKKQAENCNVDSNRIIFSKKILDHNDHLSRLRLCDLYLDTFPYGSHSAACDIIWSEIPIITLYGDSFASRVCFSILKSIKLEQLATHELSIYKNKILELSQDKNKILNLKETIRNNKKKLINPKKYASDLENIFSNLVLNN